MMFYKLIFAVVVTEAFTELITKAEITEPIRKFIFTKGHKNRVFNWLHRLLDCGYCTSVWIGAFMALFLFKDVHFVTPYLDWLFIGLVLHRFSNVLHFVIDKLRGSM